MPTSPLLTSISLPLTPVTPYNRSLISTTNNNNNNKTIITSTSSSATSPLILNQSRYPSESSNTFKLPNELFLNGSLFRSPINKKKSFSERNTIIDVSENDLSSYNSEDETFKVSLYY